MTDPVIVGVQTLGVAVWEARRALSDGAFARFLNECMASLGGIGPEVGAEHVIIGSMAAAWVDCGCPRIVTGAPYAASLMATSVSPETASGLEPPWPCFMLDAPPGVLPTNTALGDVGHLIVLWPSNPEARIATLLIGRGANGSIAYLGGDTVAHFFRDLSKPLAIVRASGAIAATDTVLGADPQRSRVLELLGRYLASVLAALNSTEHLDPDGKLAAQPVNPGAPCPCTPRGEPATRTFTLRPVVKLKVDCRAVVTAYARGAGTSPTVQSFVAGHWRRVPVGPRAELRRKLTRIEPFWRGPETAPIADRAHKLGA